MSVDSGAIEMGKSWSYGGYTFKVTNTESDTGQIRYTASCNSTSKTTTLGNIYDYWCVSIDGSSAMVYAGSMNGIEYNIEGKSYYGHNAHGDFYKTEDAPAFTFWSGNSTYHDGRGELYLLSDTKEGVASNRQTECAALEYEGKTYYLNYGKGHTDCSGVGPYIGEIPWEPTETGMKVLMDILKEEGYIKSTLIATFAISPQVAGGGDGADWDWGDITATLHVTVKGAHSGRHTDALADALDGKSQSDYLYQAADNTATAGYGCGGDGGHGGGGGAGASTVVVHNFGTWRASQKDVKAYAKGHGYGGGGGKGATGGDGIILIYY